jgi:alpha-L-rhamnosidase
MKKWMDYMRVKYMKDYIMTKDKYGDWCVPPESLEIIRSRDSTRTTKGELLASATYFRLLQCMQKFARISGRDQDITAYKDLAEKMKQAFNKKFLIDKKGYYDNNTVTANILPLYFGIVPDSLKNKVFNSICHRISVTDNNHISTGVIGTQWLMRGLSRFGRPDLAFKLASNKTYPSWGYMTEQGATTIWELWNGNTANPQMNSQNHVMLLGDLLIWFYENLAGIKSDENEVAFSRIIMKPSFVSGLTEVKAYYDSPHGMINSHWKKDGQLITWYVTIPANTKAELQIPASKPDDVKEGGKSIASTGGISFVKMENGNAIFELGSGTYSFTTINSPF